jgi:hypothetical protein
MSKDNTETTETNITGTLTLRDTSEGVEVTMKCTGEQMLHFITSMVLIACESGANVTDLNAAISKGMINSDKTKRQQSLEEYKTKERTPIVLTTEEGADTNESI